MEFDDLVIGDINLVSPRDVLVTLLSPVPQEEAALEVHRSAAILEVTGLMDAKPANKTSPSSPSGCMNFTPKSGLRATTFT
jgi:hypothetical protein